MDLWTTLCEAIVFPVTALEPLRHGLPQVTRDILRFPIDLLAL